MIIEIDDAGTGCPLGGAVIGALKERIFKYTVIPVSVFKDGTPRELLSRNIIEAINYLLNAIHFDPEEDEIRICRGSFFKPAFRFFDDKGWNWTPVKINSKLQDLIEASFDFHLVELGVPRFLVKRLIHYRDYVVELLKWVALKPEEREELVKTSFNVWKNEWRYTKLEFAKKLLNRRRYCIECGLDIEKGRELVEVKFITPRRVLRGYLHIDCWKKLER